jgi:hypothetical protein
MTRKLAILLIILILTAFLVLSGCQKDQTPLLTDASPEHTLDTVLSDNSNESEETVAGYPDPQLQIITENNSGYPEPEIVVENFEAELSQPILPLQLEPSEIGATIGGLIIDEITQQAPPESIIYLGTLKYTENGFPVVSLNRNAAPLAILPPNGAFVLENVAPGEYALVFFTPDFSFLVEDNEGVSVIFTVEEGDVLDLGTFLVSTP